MTSGINFILQALQLFGQVMEKKFWSELLALVGVLMEVSVVQTLMTERVILKKIQGFTLMCINMSIGSERTQQLGKRVIVILEVLDQELGLEQNVVPRTSVIENIVFIVKLQSVFVVKNYITFFILIPCCVK